MAMESIIEQIRRLPNGDNILRLFSSAKQKLGNSALTIRDYNERGENGELKGYGRYERDKGVIWIQMRHPPNVVEYCLAHEIGHVMQDAEGFPRISIKDILRDYKVYHGNYQPEHPYIICSIHKLTERISGLILDPYADSFARLHKLSSRDALLYMKQRDLDEIQGKSQICFDSMALECGVTTVITSIKSGTDPDSLQIVGELELQISAAVRALVYAIQSLRYSQESLFDCLSNKYIQEQPADYKLGEELLDLIGHYQLNTANACTNAAKDLINRLQLPPEAASLRTSQGWIA